MSLFKCILIFGRVSIKYNLKTFSPASGFYLFVSPM